MVDLKLPLSNVQIELMKLYATGLSEEDLLDLKDVLARFFAEKATIKADAVWQEKGLSDQDMDAWLNQKS